MIWRYAVLHVSQYNIYGNKAGIQIFYNLDTALFWSHDGDIAMIFIISTNEFTVIFFTDEALTSLSYAESVIYVMRDRWLYGLVLHLFIYFETAIGATNTAINVTAIAILKCNAW